MSSPVRAVWYTRCPSPTASSVAIAWGFLREALEDSGVEAHSLRAATQRTERQAHFTQDHEALFRQGGIVPPLWAASRGVRTRLIGLSRVRRFQGVIALPGSGIELPADLRGRRLGLPLRTSEPVDFWRAQSWRGLLKALEIAGIDEADVAWVNLPTEAPYHVSKPEAAQASLWTAREASRLQAPEVRALLRGEVDAIYTYAPAGLPLIELLDATVVLSLPPEGAGSSGIGSLSALTVSERLLDQRPYVVTRYVGALLAAADWAASNPAATLRVMAAEEGVAEEWAVESFGPELAGSLAPDLSPSLVHALQEEADFLAERGFLAAPVDIALWQDGGPLQRARAARSPRFTHHLSYDPTTQRTLA